MAYALLMSASSAGYLTAQECFASLMRYHIAPELREIGFKGWAAASSSTIPSTGPRSASNGIGTATVWRSGSR